MRYRNADEHSRVFNHLTNPDTGATLELAPGEEVDLPDEIEDAHLVPVANTPPALEPEKPKKGRDVAPEPTDDNKEEV